MTYQLATRHNENGVVPGLLSVQDSDLADRAQLIATQVAAEIALLRDKAEAEGRACGEASAHSAAQAEASTVLATALTALRTAWSQLASPLAHKEQELAELVTDLSFELAKHIVGVEVSTSTESLKALVVKLIKEAATERGLQQIIVIRLNPVDHTLLDPVMLLDSAKLLADPEISRGGAMVEIITLGGDPSEKIQWDATIETRTDAIRAALALHNSDLSDAAVKL